MRNSFCPRYGFAAFCGCWLLGLLLGILAAVNADIAVVSMMRRAALCRVSIVLQLFWCAFPLLIAAWSVLIQRFEILLLASFCRCAAFGFFLWLEVRAFGSAAWLVVPLSRFSDWLSLGALCLLCVMGLRGRQGFWISFLLTVFAVIVDFVAVSPWLAGL